jgi:hypothetical protein
MSVPVLRAASKERTRVKRDNIDNGDYIDIEDNIDNYNLQRKFKLNGCEKGFWSGLLGNGYEIGAGCTMKR